MAVAVLAADATVPAYAAKGGCRALVVARFILVTASAPCQCSALRTGPCTCSAAARARYAARLCGPLGNRVSPGDASYKAALAATEAHFGPGRADPGCLTELDLYYPERYALQDLEQASTSCAVQHGSHGITK
jgi:Magnesium chelatase, subunit ChlI